MPLARPVSIAGPTHKHCNLLVVIHGLEIGLEAKSARRAASVPLLAPCARAWDSEGPGSAPVPSAPWRKRPDGSWIIDQGHDEPIYSKRKP